MRCVGLARVPPGAAAAGAGAATHAAATHVSCLLQGSRAAVGCHQHLLAVLGSQGIGGGVVTPPGWLSPSPDLGCAPLTQHCPPLSPAQVNIIKGALDLTHKTAKTAMTPLDMVFMLPASAPLDEATLMSVLASGHSRIPVHRPGDRGQILGILLVKELILVEKVGGWASGDVGVLGILLGQGADGRPQGLPASLGLT